MASNKLKTAYTLFLVSFSIWLFLIGLAIIPTISKGSQIQFPNPVLQTLFITSTTTTAAGCILFGAYYLGSKEIPVKQTGITQRSRFIKAEMQAQKEATKNVGIIVREEQEAIVAKKRKK